MFYNVNSLFVFNKHLQIVSKLPQAAKREMFPHFQLAPERSTVLLLRLNVTSGRGSANMADSIPLNPVRKSSRRVPYYNSARLSRYVAG